MRLPVLAALALPLALSACALTPRQLCEAPYRADLRTVMTEIRETQLELERGYALVPARFEFGLHYCLRPSGAVYLCRAEDGQPMYDKRPINRAAELAKLRALQKERVRLTTAIAQCAARYPE